MTKPADKFPRSAELPTQSPLFWVQQKDRYLRQLLIRDIEQITQRRLIVYYANRYENAQIDIRDTGFMAELLIDVQAQPTDLLLETIGGFTDAVEGLISLIQKCIPDFRVLVPNAAKSNGTLLCLASKSIVMGATSELGPIEPHVQGIPCTILTQQKIADQNYPLHKYGEYALLQSSTLATKLLQAGMMKEKTPSVIDETVKKLSSRDTYFSHGSVIDHLEATALGLTVEYLPPDDALWKRIWLLYCMYEHDSRKDRYLKIFEGHSISTAIGTQLGATQASQPNP